MWFDTYRAEAQGKSLTLTGGDSFGGATPPISNFFEDKPTPPIMNLMGVTAEALGNHTFDRGEQFLRTQLIPLANFDMISSNVVFANGRTEYALPRGAVTDTERLRQLSAFFFWTSWAASTSLVARRRRPLSNSSI